MPWDDRIKRRVTLRDLDVLMTVAQVGGMGKAATRLGMSQPSVSKSIADLENTLGVQLLYRSKRGAEPTQFGRALIMRGFAVFDELRHGVEDIDHISDPTAGEIRVGATGPISATILPTVINQLSKKHRKLDFSVITNDTAVLSGMLAERKIELAIARTTRAASKNLSKETLFYDELVVAAGRRNPLVRRRDIELIELLDEPWLMYPADTYFGSLIDQGFRAAGCTPPRRSVSTTSQELRRKLLETGRYLTVVPHFSIIFPDRHAILRRLPVKFQNDRNEVAVLTLKGQSLSPIAQLFIECLLRVVRPLSKLDR